MVDDRWLLIDGSRLHRLESGKPDRISFRVGLARHVAEGDISNSPGVSRETLPDLRLLNLLPSETVYNASDDEHGTSYQIGQLLAAKPTLVYFSNFRLQPELFGAGRELAKHQRPRLRFRVYTSYHMATYRRSQMGISDQFAPDIFRKRI